MYPPPIGKSAATVVLAVAVVVVHLSLVEHKLQVKDLLAVAAILGSRAPITAAVEVDLLRLVPVGIQAAPKQTEAMVPQSLALPTPVVVVAETPGYLL